MNHAPIKTNVRNRVLFAAFALVAGFTVVSSHLITIQGVQHEMWLERAEADYARRVVLPARRGEIFDRNGEQLVHNRPACSLVADRHQMEDYTVMTKGLAKAWNLQTRDLQRVFSRRSEKSVERLKGMYREVVARALAEHLPGGVEAMRASLVFGNRMRLVLAEGLDVENVARIKEDLAKRHLDGLDFENGMGRYYPNGSSMCHILGFVDNANRGFEGVEASMESWLAGEPGHREMMVDRRGRQVPAYRSRETPPKHGANVHLTVDAKLQRIVEEELAAAESEFLFKKAAVVLMEPSTGDILALANRPWFDPNTREGERRNFAFSDVYEPGSTFKVVAALAALDLGVVTPRTTIFCHN